MAKKSATLVSRAWDNVPDNFGFVCDCLVLFVTMFLIFIKVKKKVGDRESDLLGFLDSIPTQD